MADTGSGIELRVANRSTFQRWDWNGFGWVNEAAGLMLKANGGGAPLTGVKRSSSGTPAQLNVPHHRRLNLLLP